MSVLVDNDTRLVVTGITGTAHLGPVTGTRPALQAGRCAEEFAMVLGEQSAGFAQLVASAAKLVAMSEGRPALGDVRVELHTATNALPLWAARAVQANPTRAQLDQEIACMNRIGQLVQTTYTAVANIETSGRTLSREQMSASAASISGQARRSFLCRPLVNSLSTCKLTMPP